mgnify:CR=1 FL=1
MFKLSISTSYTNPEERMDPWREALTCYNDLADEVVRSGENWPYEFSWDHIGKTFHSGFQQCKTDWVIRMDLDYFFHEEPLKQAHLHYIHINHSYNYARISRNNN